MQTTPIANQSVAPQAQIVAGSEEGAELYNEFSETLDKIASKVSKQKANAGADIPALVADASKHPAHHIQLKVKSEQPKPAQEAKNQVNPDSAKKDRAEISKPRIEQKTEPSEVVEEDVLTQGTEEAQEVEEAAVVEEVKTDVAEEIVEQPVEQEVLTVQPDAEKVVDADTQELAARTVVQQQSTDKVQENIDFQAETPVNEGQQQAALEDKPDAASLLKQEPVQEMVQEVVEDANPHPVAEPTPDVVTAAPVPSEDIEKPQAAPQVQQAPVQAEAPQSDQADLALKASYEAAVKEVDAPQVKDSRTTQELLSQTLERIIQNKLLEAAANTVAVAQRGMAFEHARESAQARNVISQLNQSVGEAGAKPGLHNGGQAQGLQLTNTGAFSRADSSQREEVSKGGAGLSKPQATRTMEKVENALKEVSKSKDGKTISVRLDPPELGTVKVDISYLEGSLHARIAAEQGSVGNLLKERTQEIVSMIRKLGLNVDKVTVTVTSSGDENAANLFESLNKDGGNKPNQNQQQGRRFGAEQGADTHSRANVADDHWIA